MDITPQDTTTQPMSDDQELAKALAGVLPDDPASGVPANDIDLQFEETLAPVSVPPVAAPAAVPTVSAPEAPIVPDELPVVPAFDMPAPALTPSFGADTSNLEDIKKDAIQELRPIIDRVDLPPEEKFDTYLLLIRSTDDATLIGPAHVAAQNITDEKKKAEALLDIIKEIDFLSRKDQPAA